MKSRKWIRVITIVIMASLLLAVPLLSACTKEKIVEVPVEKVVEKEVIKEVPVEKVVVKEVAKEAPLTRKVLKVGVQYDLTGTYRTVDLKRSAGCLDWFKYVNEEKGGVSGVKIEPILVESGLNVPKGISNYQTLKEEGIIAHCEGYTGISMALKEEMIEDQMACFISATAIPQMVQPTTIACTGPAWIDHLGAYVRWIVENWEGEGKPKLAILGADFPANRELVSDQAHAYIEAAGVELVAEELFAMTMTDASPHLLRLKESGAQFTFALFFPPQASVLLKDMDRLDLTGNITIATAPTSMPPDFEKVAAEHPEWLENIVISYVGYPPEDPEFPGEDPLLEICKRYNPDKWQELYSSHYLFGSWKAMRAEEAIRLALEKVPYEDITSRDVLDGMYSMRDFHMWNTAPPTSYSEDAPTMGWTEVPLYTWRAGKFTKIPGVWEAPGWWK